MMLANPMLWGGGDPLDEFGRIDRSLRFRSSATAYLTRAVTTLGSRKTWTFSTWLKRSAIGTTQAVLSAGDGIGTNQTSIRVGNTGFAGIDVFQFCIVDGQSTVGCLVSNSVLRDFGSWYHLVVVLDTDNMAPSERMRAYINGQRLTYFQTQIYPPQGSGSGAINAPYGGTGHRLGQSSYTSELFDGYLAQPCFVDGVALPPTAFGRIHPKTSQWRPFGKRVIKAVVDAGGAQSWFLPFDDTTSLTTLCSDVSQFGNHWSANNLSLASGASYDNLLDSPTNNFATISRLDCDSYVTVKDGGLQAAHSSPNVVLRKVRATMPCLKSGKSYFEVMPSSIGGLNYTGAVGLILGSNNVFDTTDMSGVFAYREDGQKYLGSSSVAPAGAAYTNGDVIGVLFDSDASMATFSKNGVVQATVPIPAGAEVFPGSIAYGLIYSFNFGQRPFVYPVVGARAICTKNLAWPTDAVLSPRRHFDIKVHTGNGGQQSITGVAFQPDFVWLKSRSSSTSYHQLHDSIRGAGRVLWSNSTAAESMTANTLTSFNQDGFAVGTDTSYNAQGESFVDWMWRAGGPAVANSNGTIPCQVSANPIAGFSIVTWKGTGQAGAVGHGLGQSPKFFMMKNRSNSSTSWGCWHSAFGSAGSSDYIDMDKTISKGGDGAFDFWNGLPPSSTVINVGTVKNTSEQNSSFVAYCFAEVPGFSKFGSYAGNGSTDGTFVYCGFRPRYILIKNITSSGSNWVLVDAVRTPINPQLGRLVPNTAGAEDTGSSDEPDFVANGFKLRGNGIGANRSGDCYIFAAFSEFPFRYANAR